jgi:hypothetical protein
MLAEWGLSDVDEELLSGFDTDGNGTYRFAEFVNFFNELAPESEAERSSTMLQYEQG